MGILFLKYQHCPIHRLLLALFPVFCLHFYGCLCLFLCVCFVCVTLCVCVLCLFILFYFFCVDFMTSHRKSAKMQQLKVSFLKKKLFFLCANVLFFLGHFSFVFPKKCVAVFVFYFYLLFFFCIFSVCVCVKCHKHKTNATIKK